MDDIPFPEWSMMTGDVVAIRNDDRVHVVTVGGGPSSYIETHCGRRVYRTYAQDPVRFTSDVPTCFECVATAPRWNLVVSAKAS